MRQRLLVVVCFAMFAFFAALVPAAPDALVDLRTELQERKDNDYAPPLDKAHKKELKAVVKAIALVDKPFANLGARMKTFATLAKGLAKAFPTEFAKTKATTSLRVLLDAVVQNSIAQGEASYQALAAAVPGIRNATLHNRAEAQRVAAREDLDLAAAAATPADAFKALASAMKAIAKGLGYAAKDPHVETVSASLDGVPYSAENVHVEITDLGGQFLIDASGNTSKPGTFTWVQLTSSGLNPVTGPGTYTGSGIVKVGTDPVTITESYYTNNASFEVTALDTAAKTMKATFSFTADNAGSGHPLQTITVTNGVVDTVKAIIH